MPRISAAAEDVGIELEDVELLVENTDVGGVEVETGELVEENVETVVEDSVDGAAEGTTEELAGEVTGGVEDMAVEDTDERVDVVETTVDNALEAEDSTELAVLLPGVELLIEDSVDEATELTVDATELLLAERATEEDADEKASVEATEALETLLANEEATIAVELLITGVAVDAVDDGSREVEDETSTTKELVVDDASEAGVELAEVSTTVEEDGASVVDWISVLETITSLLVLGVGVALAEP